MLREAKLGIMIAMQMKDLSSYESGMYQVKEDT